MRFHTTAVIHVHDPSRVWPALEGALREVTIEATRTGNLLMLRGLGTSSVSMNNDDFAILTIEEHQGAVSIEADGVFDGSYLGAGAGPEDAVRSKLDRMFDEIQKRFDLEEMPTPRVSPAINVVAKVEEISRAEADVSPRIRANKTDVRVKHEEATRDAEVTNTEVVDKPEVDPPRPPITTESTTWAPIVPVSNRSKAAQPELIISPMLGSHGELPTRRLTDIQHPSFRQFGYLAASVPILLLTLAGIYGVERYLERRESYTTIANSGTAATRVDSATPESKIPAVSPPIPPQPPDHSADPKTLLNHWEGAMRTRDAAAQSAFYADPVDRYQDQAFVTRMALQQEKQAAIAERKGLWTVKLEAVVIERHSADEVSVRLVKHFIDQPGPSQISEKFVPTQLLLRRVDGDWKIVSERDFSPLPNPVDSPSKFPEERLVSKFQS